MNIWVKILSYAVAIGIAIYIIDSEIVQSLITRITPVKYVAEFVAGMLYTSLLTIPISVAMLASIAETSNIYFIALLGGIGAMCGDYILMNFFSTVSHKIHLTGKFKNLEKIPKSLLRVLGILCLMVPVPDEAAMTLLGINKMRVKTFVLIVYPAKAFGIFMVTLGAVSVLGVA